MSPAIFIDAARCIERLDLPEHPGVFLLAVLPWSHADGRSVPLAEVADVAVRKMPEMIRDDNGKLSGYIYVDLQNVTGPDYVERAQAHLGANLTLPPGYTIEWTGLYQYAAAARARLRLVVPLTLIIIFGLLVIAFRSVAESVLILLSVPFAMIGGVFRQWRLGYPMTTAVIVGYSSLFAVAVQTGIIMVIFIRAALDHRTPGQSYVDAGIAGSATRLRPKLMTVAAIVLSLLPVMFAAGRGMEIMKPIAAPSIGGMVTSSLHVLFMTPYLFVIGEHVRLWWQRRRARRRIASPQSAQLSLVLSGSDRHVEMGGIDGTGALDLHPDAVRARAREHERELHLRAAVGNVGMRGAVHGTGWCDRRLRAVDAGAQRYARRRAAPARAERRQPDLMARHRRPDVPPRGVRYPA